MIEWNIQLRAHACQACQKPFADKEFFHTVLYDQKHSYERLDVCEACWNGQFSQGAADRKGFVSHWVSVYAAPPAAPPEPIGKENAESLLRKLIEQNDPTHPGARFILAVMLERKRLLKVKAQVTEEGRRIFIYEHPPSGDLFQIADPNLQLDQLEDVQRDVANLLEHGLTPKHESASSSQAAEDAAAPVVAVAGVPSEPTVDSTGLRPESTSSPAWAGSAP